ncbi:unnamed protein product, partial [Prorocentrum cordatum]
EHDCEAGWIWTQKFNESRQSRDHLVRVIAKVLVHLHDDMLDPVYVVDQLHWKYSEVLTTEDLWMIAECDLRWQAAEEKPDPWGASSCHRLLVSPQSKDECRATAAAASSKPPRSTGLEAMTPGEPLQVGPVAAWRRTSAPRQRASEEKASDAGHEKSLRAIIVRTSKSLIDSATSSHGHCTTFYHIELSDPADTRTFTKRYSDFRALDKRLRKTSPALHRALPELPESGMFGLRHSLGLESFERRRREGLQAYLDVAAAELDEATLRAFLGAQRDSAPWPPGSAPPPADAGDGEGFVSATSGSEGDNAGAGAGEAGTGASGAAEAGQGSGVPPRVNGCGCEVDVSSPHMPE